MPAAGLRGMDGSNAGHVGAVACLGGLSGASFQGLLRRSNQGFGDGCHTPMDNG